MRGDVYRSAELTAKPGRPEPNPWGRAGGRAPRGVGAARYAGSLSHFQQSAEGHCLSACVRMVLTHLGLERSEAEVSQVLGAREFGTPSFAVRRLIAEELQVTYGEWSVAQYELARIQHSIHILRDELQGIEAAKLPSVIQKTLDVLEEVTHSMR